MDEVEDYLGEDFFEETDNNATDQNAIPSDAELLKKAFKDDESVKATRKLRPQPKLGELELCGPKGIDTLEEVFKEINFDPKKNPYKNLSLMMNKLEYWAHLLHPSINFDDFIAKVESLGEKRMVQAHMNRLRFGDFTKEDREEEDEHGNRADEDAPSGSDSNAVFSSKPKDEDDIDEIIRDFYENPDDVIVSNANEDEAAVLGSTAADINLGQVEVEVREKRQAFLNKITEDVLNKTQSSPSGKVSEEVLSQMNAEEDDSLMDDISALEFIYSTN